jgi:hypothetical protein
MKVIYATLTAVFILIMLQSYAVENPNIFNELDSSLKRLDSMTIQTHDQVVCLYEHHERNERTIDSLNNVIGNMKKVKLRRSTIVHDTVFVAVDPD